MTRPAGGDSAEDDRWSMEAVSKHRVSDPSNRLGGLRSATNDRQGFKVVSDLEPLTPNGDSSYELSRMVAQ
jgi:hypothetical protein